MEHHTYYEALVRRDVTYEGTFFVGVKTTGIFCRPTCPARKPKAENCEFFETAQEALLASYRPCRRCHPLAYPGDHGTIQRLIEAVEAEPDKRFKEADFRALGLDESTARRQFKKRFGMTFVAYARARRMGLAMKEIRTGKSVIEGQLTGGYESSSGFREASTRMLGEAPSRFDGQVLRAKWLDTPLGSMLAIADEQQLHLLEFVDRRGLEREIEQLRKKARAVIVPGESPIFGQIEAELRHYFRGEPVSFQTPLMRYGTPFQRRVWEELERIPSGETISYQELAIRIGQPTAVRAVARANGANQLAIIIPCHRVIRMNGDLGGYAGGLARKETLLKLERTRKGLDIG
ncbi:trifunctional transcriptional activator/DNA repair protein Ada/methylated-DNA--[protein]-cysteine S-methyltransferase [Exiguobacterium sp. BRG2]|uniref:bifunctional transcriptional activator/DNA repair enzyme AdaA n=1 Tax=Exiguobacterium sp. BRG2 TaxID=2962584 RepID=UPI0028825F79|nr:trifunctional transcriptional activator/DNA repair protein Ada/methylated-DNA--[protein]-cysteine S-methyltransferase [Exiguobacterium sp. BRG2]MDT0174025.1 trifunctional transcriptional activator/DNA repair protein Ada/methylated-DNA--[protein]-cysteine S-methyltransferase [Exiguobacterium sp. BRG2]